MLTWNDNSITETSFAGAAVHQPRRHLDDHQRRSSRRSNQPNIHQTRTYTDPSTFNPTTTTRYYRVVAQNTVGYVADAAFPQMTAQSVSNTRVVGPSFTITASAGAGGTISPTGAVTVGRGGSQTFTITPNASFRIATVLVDGVNNADGGVDRHVHLHERAGAAHHRATFTQSAGDHHLECRAPAAASRRTARRRWPIGGSQIYTITPNNGYSRATVLVDGVNDPAAVTSGTYTFTNVTANHTISATFKNNAPSTITVTAPTGTSSQAQGSQPAGHLDDQRGRRQRRVQHLGGEPGQRLVRRQDRRRQRHGQLREQRRPSTCPAARATASSSTTAPSARDPWGIYGFSLGYGRRDRDPQRHHRDRPDRHEQPDRRAATLPVTWTTNAAVATGEFSIWVVSPANGWYVGKIVAANGTASYADSVNLDVPADDRLPHLRLLPRDQHATRGASTAPRRGRSTSPAASRSPPRCLRQLPLGHEPAGHLDHRCSVATGEYSIWVVSPANDWYLGKIVAANGTASYADSVVLNMPVDVGYRVFVYYRATPTDPWGTYAVALGTVTIQ